MQLFDVPLKIIATQQLTDSDTHKQLTVDVRKWEEDAVPDSDNKMKALYGKLHASVLMKLAMPFLYIFLFKMFRDITTPDDGLDDDFSKY